MPGEQPAPRRWAALASVVALIALTTLLGACHDSVGSVGPRASVVFAREPSGDTIFVADPDSGEVEQRIALPMVAYRFGFSPAGDRLAIVSDGGTLWVMNPDGSDAKQLTSDVYNIAWSPDGARIAYVKGPRPKALHVVGADGSGDTIVPGATPDGWDGLAWSPDGRRIAFEGMRTLNGGDTRTVYVINTDGTGLRDIDASLPGPEARAAGEPTWSPDGRRIAIGRYLRYSDFDEETTLWVITLATGEAQRITAGDGGDRRPTWSPNGDQIAFLRFDGSSSDVFVVRPDGTGLRQITDTPEREEEPHFWRRR